MIRLGIDIGSTTVKVAAVDGDGKILFSRYERHHAKAFETLQAIIIELLASIGDVEVSVRLTGSVGMGFSERCGFPFVQEVVAATKAIQKDYPQVQSMIDIGGEDAKVVFFRNGEASDLRMNGNCAGGTGAFIDQMAVILGVGVEEMDGLALNSTMVYPIASRCGVFCKTDIQNLVAKNVPREDIAASIFHAVAVQTIVTLAHGCDIGSPVLMCGGPMTFIPALRKAFIEYMAISEEEVIIPEHGTMLPAIGAAISDVRDESACPLSLLVTRLHASANAPVVSASGLQPIFNTTEEYGQWQRRMAESRTGKGKLTKGEQDVYIGIDSGSTTTKIVVTDPQSRILYSFYSGNSGNPVETVERGLDGLKAKCDEAGAVLNIRGCCSTGYGEDLIKAAFQLNYGIVETMAHYMAARHLRNDVSFILDIGGQDMKAIFVNSGVISRIEINEACSSGCGSFIETFARTMGYKVSDFAAEACRSLAPCDLGTRCTVFMNSKVKQVLREGASVADISVGLAYSVVKNCLYKVLKLKDLAVLGKSIVVQGGTMRNDAIVRALELLTGLEVTRCDVPELMGALGCAIYAMSYEGKGMRLDDMIAKAHYTSRNMHCKGCDNQCLVVRYKFDNGRSYYSGNRCEKVFANGEAEKKKGENVYLFKNGQLFKRGAAADNADATKPITLGIPRCLNMYEDYPFWHTLFTSCGLNVVLSDDSRFPAYEKSACKVMSDNICFPAKLVHSHVQNIIDKKVDRIFLPFVVYERSEKSQDSFNCPVVTGYSEVIKSVQSGEVPIDSPSVTFKDRHLLLKQCREYLSQFGVSSRTVGEAFEKAEAEQDKYYAALVAENEAVLSRARHEGKLTIMLAGRPYHTDSLVQHKVSDMLADMGISVITDDIVRDKDIKVDDSHFLAQWAYPNRILKAAKWCASQDADVQFVEMTSFGCGPDAFLVDEVKDILMRSGKVLTLLKFDDINNVGSMKLRVRSLVESLKLAGSPVHHEEEFKTLPIYDESYRGYKILVPFFTPFISPLIPAIMRVAGYDVENLPLSDMESCNCGLKYANNEVCYPATLIVGDIVKAFESGRYDPKKTVVAMTQTGGQCRASNYVALIKRALVNAGYTDVPVLAITFGGTITNEQPGFKVNWLKMLPIALRAVIYSDCIAKFYYASVVREKEPGQAERLKQHYLELGDRLIRENKSSQLRDTISKAADDFNEICNDVDCPKVGVVGEIFLKFNPFAQKNVTEWLTAQGIEVIPPMLADFFLQIFVNKKTDVETYMQERSWVGIVYKFLYKQVRKQYDKINAIASRFRYFEPFGDLFEEADEASKVITLNAQFGEGWLLPAEVMSYARQGVRNVVSLQPFGCIANHIVSKGIEKRIKSYYPDMNMLSLDFDGGVSDVNITNRLLLFIDNIKK